MHIPDFPFTTLPWETIPREPHPGISGMAWWQVFQMDKIRIRLVEYEAGYWADHWCEKGHIIHCIEGEMETTLADERKILLSKGMTYVVGDESMSHRTRTEKGCKLFIVD